MKKLLFLAASAAIVFSLNSCSSESDENITPKEAAMKTDALSRQGMKKDSATIGSSASKLTPPTPGDNPDDTIDPTKPDRPR
ncbi:hypothetical protein BBH99_20200 [Chryseobacterium contaminans]|uniref:Uncharacterized protein n=1 Tax=Chryseobacterium contaminans TaxID=1423959 RepID=A0A1M7CQ37_9FLAO|nr:hypothetical protein [Chryseobacterium contaminans]OCA78933.1 hypothetical protein BBH99_20200 [Chryseobacterium contaminans]SHL69297.1 hypothetical protein SAMN05444407_105319 [Chryseobacterium contaminans]